MQRTGQRNHAFEVGNLAAFDFEILFCVIGIGQVLAQGLDTRTSMSAMHDFGGIKPMLARPLLPDPRDRGSGIDEHTVQVKQNCSAGKFQHLLQLNLPRPRVHVASP